MRNAYGRLGYHISSKFRGSLQEVRYNMYSCLLYYIGLYFATQQY